MTMIEKNGQDNMHMNGLQESGKSLCRVKCDIVQI